MMHRLARFVIPEYASCNKRVNSPGLQLKHALNMNLIMSYRMCPISGASYLVWMII